MKLNLQYLITLFTLSFYTLGFSQTSDFRIGPVIGGVTNEHVRIFAAMEETGNAVLEFDTDEDFTQSTQLLEASVESPFYRLFFTLENLEAQTTYFFRIYREDNPNDTINGSFKTFPEKEDVSDFVFTFGSCMKGAPMEGFFENMKDNNPAFFLHLGDYTYPDGEYNRDAYLLNDTIIDSSYVDRYTYPGMASFLSSTPVGYIYDDHDYTRNNSGKTTYSRDSIYEGEGGISNYLWEPPLLPGVRRKAIEAYAKYFPAYEMPDTSEGLYHSFRHGQAEIFFVDTRSSRTPNHHIFEFNPDGGLTKWTINPPENHTILGTEQMNWLLDALENSDATWKFIVSGVTFNKSLRRLMDFGIAVQWLTLDIAGRTGSGMTLAAGFSDGWPGFTEDQDRLINFVRNNDLDNVILLTGDTHTSAMDDGTNSGLPEFNSSCLEVNESVIGLYAIADSVGKTLGQPAVKDSLWNKGASGLNGVNTLAGFGRVEVFGKDSVRMCQVDRLGTVTYCWTFEAGFKAPTSVSYLDKLLDNPLLNIYPNPASHILNVELELVHNNSDQVSWQIVDILGRKHQEGIENIASTANTSQRFTVNLENVKSGYYFLIIDSDSEPVSKMFFKE